MNWIENKLNDDDDDDYVDFHYETIVSNIKDQFSKFKIYEYCCEKNTTTTTSLIIKMDSTLAKILNVEYYSNNDNKIASQ